MSVITNIWQSLEARYTTKSLTFMVLALVLVSGAYIANLVLNDPVGFLYTMPNVCMFKNTFHIPCASCGMTRAFMHMGHGDFATAFRYHPLSVPLFLGSIGYFTLGAVYPTGAIKIARWLATLRALLIGIFLLGITWVLKILGPQMYW